MSPVKTKAVTQHRLDAASKLATKQVSPAHLAMAATAGSPSPWMPYKWLRLLNRKLMDMARAREAFARTGKVVGTHFLIIEAPVRHGKSELGSVWFPTWWLGTFPDDRVILTGNNAELAEGFSRRVRDTLRDRGQELFGPGIRVSQESSSVYRWDLAAPHRGGLIAVGVGSPPTGRGAHCLSGETLVTTEEGEISIAALIALPVQPRVLSFNHDTNQAEWASVEAHRSLRGDEIVEVITTTGRIIRCTPEHLFFSNGRYVQAGSLSPGDSLTVREGQDALSSVWDVEEAEVNLVPIVRASRKDARDPGDVRVLRQDISPAGLRGGQERQERAQGRLLQPGLHSGSHGGEVSSEMPNLWRAYGEEDQEILRSLPGSWQDFRRSPTSSKALPRVRNLLSAAQSSYRLLSRKLRRRGAFSQDEGQGELSLQNGHQLRQAVRGDEQAGTRARRAQVSSVYGHGGSVPRAPHQPRPDGQQARKHDPAVYPRSHQAPQVGRDTVSVVRRLRSPGHRVYDLQVAGNRNFFAGEILVHNCLIIDDPIKSDLQAYSAAWRESLWRWWLFSIRSRLEPGGVCVIIMSRWHEDDLVGRLLKRQKEADRAEELRAKEKPDLTEEDLLLEAKDKTIEDVIDRWEVLHLPALAEGPEDPLGREPGEALCPQRYDEAALLRLRDGPLGVGPVAFKALYQNNPVSATGTIFKVEKLNIIPAIPVDPEIRWIRRWDMAATEKQQKGDPDWTAGVLMGRTKAGYIIIADARRDRRNSGPVDQANTVESFMRSTAIEDQARLGRRIKIRTAQDPGQAGKALIAHYKATVMAGFDFTADPESGDKVARATPFANQVEAGNVSLVEGAWNYDYIEELRAFNLGAHDDWVDASANGYLDLAGLGKSKVRVVV